MYWRLRLRLWCFAALLLCRSAVLLLRSSAAALPPPASQLVFRQLSRLGSHAIEQWQRNTKFIGELARLGPNTRAEFSVTVRPLDTQASQGCEGKTR